MKINISDNFNKNICGEYFHDIDGNIYLKIETNYYFLYINMHDELEWGEIQNFDKLRNVDSNIKHSKINNTNNNKSLRHKLLEKIDDDNETIRENEEYTIYDEDEDYENMIKYYPEKKLYYIENDNDNSDSDEYIFAKYGNVDLIKCLSKTLDTESLYDTIVFDQQTKTILFTIESKNCNSYKVTLNFDGTMTLCLIGSLNKIFKTKYKLNNETNEYELYCEIIC